MSEVSLGIKIIADAKGARAEISSLSGDLSKLESSGKKAAGGVDATSKASDAAAKNIRNAGSAADNARKGFDSLGISAGRLAGYFTGAALIGYTKALVEIGDRANSLSARLKLVTNSAEQFASVQAELYRQAQANGASIESQTDLYGKLARATEGTGRSARDLLTVVDVMSKQLRISGASAATASAVLYQFGQVAGKAVVNGDEFVSIMEGAPTVMQGVAKALGMTTGELITLAQSQKLTTKDFLDGMVRMKEATDQQAAAISGTFSQAMQRLKNSVFEATAAINNYIGVSKAFAAATNAIADGLDRFAGTDQISVFTQRIADLRDQIERESGKPFAFLNEEKIGRMKQSLADMEMALADLKKQGETVADPLAEGFGKAKIAIDQVGKSAEATMGQIAAEAARQGVPQAFAIAIAKAESAFRQFNEDGKVLTSSAGAIGVMQLMPDTAKRFGVNAKDALDNIKGGVTYLKVLLEQFDGDMKRAAAAYNAGEGNVQKYGGVPPFKETQSYVQKVAAEFDKFKSQYPNGLDFVNAAGQKAEIAQAKSQLESYIQTQQAAAKAAETVAKSQLATENEVLAVRRKAFEEFTKQEAGARTGTARTSYLEQAARQESDQIQQQIALKQRAIGIEQQATQAELAGIAQRLAAADKLQLTEAERIALKNQQRQVTADLASLQQQSDAVAIQGAGELVQVQQQLAEAQRQEAEAIKASAAARDDYIAKLDQQIQILETGNKLISEETELHKLSAGMAADEAKAWEQTAKAKLSQIQDLEKSQKDQQKNEKAVADQVLRTGQYYQSMVQQAQQAAQGMSAAFGDTGAAIGQLIVGLAQYQDTMYNIQQRTDALLKSNRENGGGPEQEMQIRAQAMNQELTAQINNYGNLTQAAQGFFEKGTSGYQAMENATKVFRAVELALTLGNYVQMAVAGWTFTATDGAQKQIQGKNAALTGIANQANGEPYSAWARMAAMAATMAALGFAVGGAVSGGGAPQGAVARTTSKNQQGTVFGDSSAKSDSIAKALDLVAKNSSTDLAYSAAMLRSLQNIESAMAGVTNSVIRNVSAVSGLGGQNVKLGSGPMFSNMQMAMLGMDQLMGSFLWRTTKKITDWGVGAFPQALQTILESGFKGKTFTDVTTTNKFLGMTLSQSTKTYMSDMASETEKQFTLVFRSITDTVREASKAFGTSADDFNRMVETFVVRFDSTSLKGLKGEELEKAIQQQFSKIADQIAASLNIQGLDEFQKVGEGMFETLVRVADGINTANAELAALGITAIKYSEIQFKQGDVAAEIVRQSIVAFEGINSGIGDFINEAVGSAEDLISTYQDLLQSRDILKGLGLGWQDLNRTMTEAVGGVSKFLDALQSFRDNFYNPGEQLATDQVGLAREFGNLGLSLPQSKEQFRALAESIDTSTESGAELFARLIKLSDAFAQAADAADDLERKYKSYTDPFFDFKDRIQTVMDDFEAILSGRLGGIEAKFANQATLAKQQANAPLQSQISDITGTLGTRQAEVAQDYAYIAQAQSRIAQLQDLINRAMASGNSKLVGYVRAWMSETDDLNAMIQTLNSDIAGKTKDIDQLNAAIAALQKQIAQNSADIDSGQLGKKLEELTKERARILRQQGDALVQTMQDIWEQVVGVIDDARRSLARQIAELKGQRALARNSLANERDALGDLRAYQKAGGKDPQKTVSLVTAAQEAIMQQYNDRLELLTRQLEKANREAERAIRKDFRAQEKEIRVQLRVDTREINKQLRIDTREVQRDANQRIREIERAGDAAVKAYRAQVDAQIQAINAAEQAATRALEDSQQAQQDALQEQQDARMEALQDAQQQEQKVLQKAHTAQMKALQDQLSTAQQLESAYKQIADYAENLKTGGLSSLSPEAKLAEAERQYQETLAKARAGDAEAAGKVTSQADTYLQLKRAYEGSGTAYDAAYRQVLADTQALGATATQADPIQTAIEAMQESQEKELEALQKTQQDESKALQKVFQTESRALSRSQQDAMSALQKTFQDRIDQANEQAQRIEQQIQNQTDRQVARIEKESERKINQLEREAQRRIDQAEKKADHQINVIEKAQAKAIADLADPEKNKAIQELKKRTILKLESLQDVLDTAQKAAAKQVQNQIEHLKHIATLNAKQLEQLNKIGQATNAGTTAVPAYAAGGLLKPGLATVAEQGIEPIWFDRGGRVISNQEARESLSNADAKVVAKLEELKAELKAELRAIVRQGAAAYPRMVDGVEKLADTTDKAARLAKARPVAKA